MSKQAARIGDMVECLACAHGTQGCPRQTKGWAVQGSDDVFINKRRAVRKGDKGIHTLCFGENTWEVTMGSITVFINGKPAARNGDTTKHCGGVGTIKSGSSNVFIGE